MAACRHGLGCGNIQKSVLGDPHKGIMFMLDSSEMNNCWFI